MMLARQLKLRLAWAAVGAVLVAGVAWTEARFDGRSEILAATAALLWLLACTASATVLARAAAAAGMRWRWRLLVALALVGAALSVLTLMLSGIHADIVHDSFALAPSRPSFAALVGSLSAIGVLLVQLLVSWRGFARASDAVVTRLALLAASLVLVVVAGEISFFLTDNFGRNGWEVYNEGRNRDPRARFTYRGSFGVPNEFAVEICNNRLGFNDLDRELAKPEGVRRIALLGDSYVAAFQVEMGHNVARRLESSLSEQGHQVEVFAFGVSGFGPVQELELLREKVLTVSPDLVVLAFLAANDVRNSHPELETEASRRASFGLNTGSTYRVMRYLRLRFSFFMLWRVDGLLNQLRYLGQPQLDQLVFREPPHDRTWAEAWSRAEGAILAMEERCRAAGCGFAVVSLTSPPQLEAYAAGQRPADGWDFTAPDRRLESFLAAHRIPLLVLSRQLATLSAEQRRSLHFAHDGHWTAEGHRLAGEHIARFVLDRDLLPRHQAAADGASR